MKFGQYVIVTFILHALFFFSIFEIFLTSPIITGLESLPPKNKPLAKRVVIVSIDGMRHRTFVLKNEEGEFRAKHILGRACNQGVYARSITQLPTESRPGHVAFLGGFGEDVSAVMAGWKKNPVPFDTVLNTSTESWAFGSPDIVDIFSEPSHVHGVTYSEELEDFSASNADYLDTWVEDQFRTFMEDPPASVHQDGVIFFLHLLGTDTNGHAHRPQSPQYVNNVDVVDKIVKNVERIVNDFFQDDETAFVVTSDHGMTEWGSHGSGSEDETVTPFIAWGSGIRHFQDLESCESFHTPAHDDIRQIDISPTISLLLGTSLPANSIGIAPFSIFNASKENLAMLKATNLRQLWHQYEAKSRSSGIPYKKLSIEKSIEAENSGLLETETLKDVVEGIFFHHRALRPVLSTLVISMMVAWQLTSVGLCGRFLADDVRRPKFSLPIFVFTALPFILIPIVYKLSLRNSFWSFAAFISIYFFSFYSKVILQLILSARPLNLIKLIFTTSFLAFITTLIFNYRWFLSLIFVSFPFIYSLLTSKYVRPSLYISFGSLSVFPMLPTIADSGIHRWVVVVSLIIGAVLLQFSTFTSKLRTKGLLNLLLWLSLLSQTLICVADLFSLQPPDLSIYISWMVFTLSWIFPFLETFDMVARFQAISISCFSLYCLLSTFYEGLFHMILVWSLSEWMRVEIPLATFDSASFKEKSSLFSEIGKFKKDDVRRSLTFIYFIMMAFFGCGNVANLNSFSPSSILPFVHVFNPFLMGFLLFFKVILPFLPVCVAFLIIIRLLNIPFTAIFHFLVIFSDLLAFIFFFQVRDDGSWMDVGLSISYFSITLLMFLSLTLLMCVAHFMAHKKWKSKTAIE